MILSQIHENHDIHKCTDHRQGNRCHAYHMEQYYTDWLEENSTVNFCFVILYLSRWRTNKIRVIYCFYSIYGKLYLVVVAVFSIKQRGLHLVVSLQDNFRWNVAKALPRKAKPRLSG